MALQLISRVTNPIEYDQDCPGGVFNYYGCSSTIPYSEKFFFSDSFFYHEPTDRYVFIAAFDTSAWPSWRYYAFTFEPSTGAFIERITIPQIAVGLAWTNSLVNGGMGRIYAHYIIPEEIVSISDYTGGVPTTYEIAHPIVTAATISKVSGATFNVICPERGVIVVNGGGSQRTIEVWDYVNNTMLARDYLPESFVWSTAYEDTARCWALCSSANFNPGAATAYQCLVKYNYESYRMEMLTELQPSATPDQTALVAWDSKRKKLGAIRIKADSSNGAPNNFFELYSPHPAMTRITVPANIDLIKPDDGTSHFVTTLIGTKGESGSGRTISVENSGNGTVKRAEYNTGNNGSAVIEYLGAPAAESDTITVEYDETKVII